MTLKSDLPVGPKRAMGWLPDHPDFRDYCETHPEIRKILEEGEKAGRLRRGRPAFSPSSRIFLISG